MHFQAREAKLLAPGDHIVVDGCPGLRLSASRSSKAWTYRYKSPIDQRMKQLGIGYWPEMPLSVAISKWHELRQQRNQGNDLSTPRRSNIGPHSRQANTENQYTVRALVRDYLENHVNTHRKPEGAIAARRALEVVLNSDERFANKLAATVTRAEAFDLIESREDTPTAAQKIRSLLGGAWDYALDSGRLSGDTPNWWRHVMRGRLKSRGKIIQGEHVGKQRRLLDESEVGRLLNWLDHMHPIAQDSVQMYLWTCARGAEIFGMKPEHVRQEGEVLWWTVPKNKTKNYRHEFATDFRVPLFGKALEIVNRRLKTTRETDWLFENIRGEQYTQHNLSTYIYNIQPYSKKVSERTSIGNIIPVTHFSPHDLRRTSRTILSKLGCPQEVGEALIGHMPQVIIATYNRHNYDEERVYWLKKLSEYLDRISKN